jgi:hypothetical protein
MKWFARWFVVTGILVSFAGTALAQLTDDAANYGDPTPAWETGANEGAGFGEWTINPGVPGGTFLGSSSTGGVRVPDIDTGGQAFGMWHEGGTPTEAIRGFAPDVWGVGSELSFDFSFRFDSGSRGVTLHDDTLAEFAYFSITASGYDFNGTTAPPTEWTGERENGEVITFSFTQNGSDIDWAVSGVHASSPTNTGTIANETLAFFRIFNSANEGGDDNNVYFNNLSVTQGSVPPLRFIEGEASPITTGSYQMTLERTDDGDAEDTVDLSSDNTAAVTVPASVTFAALENTVSFNSEVVSVTEGSATILASNTVTGATATFTIDPIAPGLAIGGPFEVYELGVQTYTLTRFGDVSDTINLSSSEPGVLTVPATAVFDPGESQTTFDANIVGYGFSSIGADDPMSSAITDYGVNVLEPTLTLTGPTTIREGLTRTFTLTRVGPVADLVTLASTDGAVVSVPATAEFGVEENVVTFEATAGSAGMATLSASDATWDSNELDVDVYATPAGTYDEGSFYTAGWTNESNEGVGFGPWAFNHTSDPEGDPASFAGVFIGDPAAASIVGMDAESFGFFANPNGSGANAEVARSLDEALAVGQTFSFQWGLNFDSNDENSNRGFSLLAGATQVLNVNMGNSDDVFLTVYGDIPDNDVNALMFDNYGNNAFTLHFEHVTPGNLRIYGTGRDGVETFDDTYVVVGVPDNFTFYFNATDAGTDERQMYVNHLRVEGAAEPEGPTIAEFGMVGVGDLQASIAGEAGLSYYLVYVTDLSTITSVNPPVLGEWSVADAEESLAEDGTVILTDTEEVKGETRYYGILITDTPLAP